MHSSHTYSIIFIVNILISGVLPVPVPIAVFKRVKRILWYVLLSSPVGYYHLVQFLALVAAAEDKLFDASFSLW